MPMDKGFYGTMAKAEHPKMGKKAKGKMKKMMGKAKSNPVRRVLGK